MFFLTYSIIVIINITGISSTIIITITLVRVPYQPTVVTHIPNTVTVEVPLVFICYILYNHSTQFGPRWFHVLVNMLRNEDDYENERH